MRKAIIAWITKDALSIGDVVSSVFYIDENNPNVIVQEVGDVVLRYVTEGVEWHRTYEEATKRAEFMRLKRIQELKKELSRLESLSFSA